MWTNDWGGMLLSSSKPAVFFSLPYDRLIIQQPISIEWQFKRCRCLWMSFNKSFSFVYTVWWHVCKLTQVNDNCWECLQEFLISIQWKLTWIFHSLQSKQREKSREVETIQRFFIFKAGEEVMGSKSIGSRSQTAPFFIDKLPRSVFQRK